MKIQDKIFLYVKKVIEGDLSPRDLSPSITNYLIKGVLTFISYFFKFFVFIKNCIYDLHLLKPYKANASKANTFVISIGNIVAGGVGKTPFTIYLASKLIAKGLKVAVISRGYGAKKNKGNIYISHMREDKIYPSDVIGDEPYLIANRVIDAYVVVGKNKIKAAKQAVKLNVDIILLDDGFQTRKLERDLDIVLLNAKNPFSNRYFIPRGLLRESPKSLKRADLLVITNSKTKDLIKKRKFAAASIYVATNFSCIRDIYSNRVNLRDIKIACFCAIANPINFYNMLIENGFEVIESKINLDHSNFDINNLKLFASKAKEKGAEALICTEKDIVKLPKDIKLELPIFYLEINHKIIFGEEKLEEITNKILKEL